MTWSQLPVEYWQPKRLQRIVMWEDEDERLEEEDCSRKRTHGGGVETDDFGGMLFLFNLI